MTTPEYGTNILQLGVAAPDVDPGVVEMLEALLEQAKRGEILAIAGITLCTGGESGRFMSPSITDNMPRSLGMLRILQMRIEQHVDLSDIRHFDDNEP